MAPETGPGGAPIPETGWDPVRPDPRQPEPVDRRQVGADRLGHVAHLHSPVLGCTKENLPDSSPVGHRGQRSWLVNRCRVLAMRCVVGGVSGQVAAVSLTRVSSLERWNGSESRFLCAQARA